MAQIVAAIRQQLGPVGIHRELMMAAAR